MGTYLDTSEFQELPGAEVFSCVGIYAGPCLLPRAEWISNFRSTWQTPWDASVSLQWRYIGGAKDGSGRDNHFQSINYLDLSGIWAVSGDIDVRLGVNNVLDKDPPITDQGGANTFRGVYDALGRYWFAGASVKF